MLGFLFILNGVMIGLALFIGAFISWGKLFSREKNKKDENNT